MADSHGYQSMEAWVYESNGYIWAYFWQIILVFCEDEEGKLEAMHTNCMRTGNIMLSSPMLDMTSSGYLDWQG